MNEVDFLPEKCRIRQLRRHRRTRYVSLLAALALAVLAGWAVLAQQTSSLAAKAQAIEHQLKSLRAKQLEVNRLAAQRRQLIAQVKRQHQLGMAVRDAQIITALANHMPATISLTDVSMRYHTGAAAANGSHHPGQRGVKPTLAINIQGIAPDDMTVADFVSTLTRDPLFSKVTMRFSRPTTRGSVLGREFELTMSVDLTRQFVAAAIPKEVARAN